MITLVTPTQKLEVVLGSAVTTNELPMVATYVDVGPTTFVPGARNTESTSTTPEAAVYAPASGMQRQVKFMSVHNADTVAATVTLRLNDDGTPRILVTVDLESASTLFYTDGQGFRVMDETGAIK